MGSPKICPRTKNFGRGRSNILDRRRVAAPKMDRYTNVFKAMFLPAWSITKTFLKRTSARMEHYNNIAEPQGSTGFDAKKLDEYCLRQVLGDTITTAQSTSTRSDARQQEATDT